MEELLSVLRGLSSTLLANRDDDADDSISDDDDDSGWQGCVSVARSRNHIIPYRPSPYHVRGHELIYNFPAVSVPPASLFRASIRGQTVRGCGNAIQTTLGSRAINDLRTSLGDVPEMLAALERHSHAAASRKSKMSYKRLREHLKMMERELNLQVYIGLTCVVGKLQKRKYNWGFVAAQGPRDPMKITNIRPNPHAVG